jgi:hypothetical protein
MGWCHANNLRILHATCALLLAFIYSAKLWHGPLNIAHILQAHPESDDGNIHCNYIAFYAANVDWPECCCWPTCTVCDIKYASVRQADTSEDEFFVDTEAHHPTNQGSHARKEIPS